MWSMADEPKAGIDPAKAAAHARMARGWGNLRPAAPGEARNPLGLNGREGAEAWRKFLDKPDPDEPDFVSRRDKMHEVLYSALKKGKLGALQIGVEQDQGKPPQSIDHKSSDRSMSPYGADGISSKLRSEIAAAIEQSEGETEGPADAAGK